MLYRLVARLDWLIKSHQTAHQNHISIFHCHEMSHKSWVTSHEVMVMSHDYYLVFVLNSNSSQVVNALHHGRFAGCILQCPLRYTKWCGGYEWSDHCPGAVESTGKTPCFLNNPPPGNSDQNSSAWRAQEKERNAMLQSAVGSWFEFSERLC